MTLEFSSTVEGAIRIVGVYLILKSVSVAGILFTTVSSYFQNKAAMAKLIADSEAIKLGMLRGPDDKAN